MTPQLERLLERFDADPSDRAAFETVEEQLFVQADWSALVPLYERHLAASESIRTPAERARLLYRLAQALEELGNEPDRAEACHRRALELDPGFAPALRRLRARSAAAGRWAEVLELAGREAEKLPRPAERAALLCEAAELCFRHGDLLRAVEGFERAVAIDTRSRRAWSGLAGALDQAGRVDEAVQAWERGLSCFDGPERAPALRALGRLLLERAGQPERALALFEAAHGDEPDDPEWIEGMAAALHALGRGEALAGLAERRIAAAGDPTRKAAIAAEAGRALLGANGAPAAARTWLLRALELEESGDVHLALAEAAGRLDDRSGRTLHLERAMELGAEIPSWSDLGLGGDPPQPAPGDLLDRLRQAVAEQPGDPDALAALSDALDSAEHDAERAEVLQRRAAMAGDGAERVERLLELGALQEGRLDDADAAVDAYESALAVDAQHPAALEAIDRLLRKLERFDALARVFDRAAEAAQGERRGALLAASGEVHLDARNDLPSASARFAAALDADPTSARALAGAGRAAAAAGDEDALVAVWVRETEAARVEELATKVPELMRRLEPLGRLADALPAARGWAARAPGTRAALETLAALLEEAGDTEELVLVLEALDGHLAGPERGANQRRLGWLHAAEGRPEQAVDAWRAALRHDPGDVASFEALLEALEAGGRVEEAVAVIDAMGSPGAEPRSLALRRARLLEQAGRAGEAAAVYRGRRTAGDRAPEILEGFERAARALGEPMLLAEALEAHAAGLLDPRRRARLDAERAALLEDRLERSGEARALWEQLAAADVEPEVSELAGSRLESLLERTGDFAGLCERLEARAERTRGAAGWSLHRRIAELAESRLGDAGRARRHLEMAVALAPGRAELWRRLAELCDEVGQPEELLRAIEGELACLDETAPETLALHARAARVAERGLGDEDRAEGHWRRVLALEPAHDEAGTWLVARAEAEGRAEDLVGLLRARLARTPPSEVDAVLDLRLHLADVLDGRLARAGEAIELLEAAPVVPATAERLFLLYDAAGRHAEAAELASAIAADAAPSHERARWWRRAGEALRTAGDGAGAEAAYEAALGADPESDDARIALCGLLRERGDPGRLVALLESSLGRPGSDERALRREIAVACETDLAAPARALEHWIRLAALDPTDFEPRERAVALAGSLGRLDDACALLRAAATDARVGAARAGYWSRCADLLAGPLARPEEAARAWRASLRLDPAQPALRRRLRETLEALGRPLEALAELRAEWESAPAAERTGLAAHAADLAAGASAWDPLAVWLDRLLADESDDPALWLAAARLHARAGRPAACERALAQAARRLDAGSEAASVREIQRERAALLEGELDAPGRAAAVLEAARRLEPEEPRLLADLDRLYTRLGRPRELLEILRVRVGAARRAEERSALARRAAETAEALGEGADAADLWLVALADVRPEGRDACRARTIDALRAVHRRDAWAPLAEEEVEAPATPAARRDALRRALVVAWIAEGRSERALPHARALVDGAGQAPDESDERTLLDLLRVRNDGVERARRLAAWLGRHPDAPDAAAGWRELARLREDRLATPAAAVEAWREAARVEPASPEAWAGVRRTAERSGAWSDVARALEAELSLGVGTPAERWRRLGRIRWTRLADPDAAEQAWQAARAEDADDLVSLRALEDLAEATGAWSRALDRYDEELSALADTDPARRRAVWSRIAAIASREAPDPRRAADAFEQAARLGPLEALELAAWASALSALGEAERWCEVFGAWLDHPEARPGAGDALALAEALAARGRNEEAEARLARAVALDACLGPAWRLGARLREAAGDPAGAATAWLRVADCSSGRDAAAALLRAAEHLEGEDPEAGLAALERAAAAAPGFAPAQAALACRAEVQGRHETAIGAASRALGPGGEPGLDPPTRLAAALAGARAARIVGSWSSAWDLAGEALVVDPTSADGLAVHGLAALALGATGECRRDLEARLADPAPDPQREQLLVALARALEGTNELEAALGRYDAALALAPHHEDAHAGRLRTLERLGRRSAAAEALAAWAACTEALERRAERYVRAARLARIEDPGAARAEPWLRAALEAEPSHATAWFELATGLWAAGRTEAAFAAACEGAPRVSSPTVRASLETLRGRGFEARGELDAAVRAYSDAVAADSDAHEAALAGARLLRRRGAWAEAALLLRRAAEGRGDATSRAELWSELGRLLAGPLEDVAGAVEAYDRAVALDPERDELRGARAALLVHVPDRSAEARRELLTLLDRRPGRSETLQRLLQLARASGDTRASAAVLALLRAMGSISPLDRTEAPERITASVAAEAVSPEGTGEALRAALAQIGPVAPVTRTEPDAAADDVATRARQAFEEAARRLVGGDLLLLAPDRLRETIETLASEARDGRLGRAGRALKQIDRAGLARLDLLGWRTALRVRAWAEAVDAMEGDLRTAFLAMLGSGDGGPAGQRPETDADLAPWIDASPEATDLLRAAARAVLAGRR